MNELLRSIDGLIKGVKSTMRIFLIVVIAIAAGWIKIVCDTNELKNDFEGGVKTLQERFNNHKQVEKSDLTNNDRAHDQLNSKGYYIIEHKLAKGETLSDLQLRYKTDFRVIQKVNKIEDVRRLFPGQIIIVPVKTSLSSVF